MKLYRSEFYVDAMSRERGYEHAQVVMRRIEEEVEKIVTARPSEDWESMSCYVVNYGWHEFQHALRYQVIITDDHTLERDMPSMLQAAVTKPARSFLERLLLKINRFRIEPDIMDTP